MLNDSKYLNENIEWAVFIAALNSYKYSSQLSSEFFKIDDKDEIKLKASKIARNIYDKKSDEEDLAIINQIKKCQKFELSLCNETTIYNLKNNFLRGNAMESSLSNMLIFRVIFPTEKQEKFEQLCQKYGSFNSFHGSDVRNFYSILNNGLHLPNENNYPGIYGHGIYLSSQLEVAMNFAQPYTFQEGLLKNESVRLIALCKIANNPQFINRHRGDSSVKNTNPKEYILVKDENFIQITHLFVQLPCNTPEFFRKIQLRSLCCLNNRSYCNNFLCSLKKHWFLSVVIIYSIILILIPLISGKSVLFTNWDSSELIN